MRFHQMTKTQRRQIAMRSDEILKKAPYINTEELAGRLGLKNHSHLYRIRKEFGCQSLKDMQGRKG